MKGDFSRVTFDAAKHFSGVLMQQGRVTVDADPNEQGAILLHYIRTLARDLIGPCGGPLDDLGFGLTVDGKGGALTIGAGRYYVDGILCENEEACLYAVQPDHELPSSDLLLAQLNDPKGPKAFWVYLDVWERHVTHVDDGRLREVALGGPDTCTRTKVVWQVKGMERKDVPKKENGKLPEGACTSPLGELPAPSRALLAAGLDPGEPSKDPCVITPDARYRGLENQLYRVEIAHGGTAKKGATFKWSRDNGSVASSWIRTEGDDLVVASTRGFSAGTWVELSDDGTDLRGEPGILVRVVSVDGDRLSIDPESRTGVSLELTNDRRNPKVRRWDQRGNDKVPLNAGAVPIVESIPSKTTWIQLEDGLRVRFAAGDDGNPVDYRSGDYWLIPARVATGDIEWPPSNAPGGATEAFQPPRGIEHHYAPLGWLIWDADATLSTPPDDCRCKLIPMSPCERPALVKAVPVAKAPGPPNPKEPPPGRRPPNLRKPAGGPG